MDLPSPSIAIVGASFAGLTLANYLSHSEWNCHVFEAKDEPIQIVGTIRLPSAIQILEELGIGIMSGLIQKNTSLVDRQSFLQTLKGRIKVEYGFRIERIESANNDDNDNDNVTTKKWLRDTKGRRCGPFDCIIITTGLALDSVSTQLILNSDAVIGDARWQYDTWFWDFGRTRVDRGGNIALEDAKELAHSILLVSDLLQKQILPNGICDRIPSKFQPKSCLRRWHTSKTIFVTVLVAVVAQILSTLQKL